MSCIVEFRCHLLVSDALVKCGVHVPALTQATLHVERSLTLSAQREKLKQAHDRMLEEERKEWKSKHDQALRGVMDQANLRSELLEVMH